MTAETSGGRVAYSALVAFTVILLLSPQAWFPLLGLFRIAFLAASIAMAAHVIDRTLHRQPITPYAPEIAIALALVGWSLITIPLSLWPGGSVRLLVDHYLKAVAFFWLLATVVSTPSRVRGLVWALVLCSIPLSGTALRNYIFGEGLLSTGVQGFYRISGYTGGSGVASNPNDLALMLNLIIPLAGALIFFERGLRRAVAGLALAMGVAAVVVTFSRAGFLTLAASFVMFLAVLTRRKAPGPAIGLVLLALCVPPLLPDGYVERLSTIANIEQDRTGSAQGRWQDVQVAADVVARNPVIGVGIGQDMIALNEGRGRDTWRSVHNAYLQYAVDLGVPGALLFAWLHVLCFVSVRRVERRAQQDPALRELGHIAAGLQVSLVAFFVAAMFHPIAYQFYFFSIGGLAVALRHASRAATPMARPAETTS